MKRLNVFLILSIFLLTLIFSACQKQEKETIVLNEVVHSIFYAPQYVALEEGFFEEVGLHVKLETGWGADKSMTALISKNADIALMGPEASIYVINEGKDDYAVNFAQLTQCAGNFLIGRKPVESFDWSTLKGTTVIGGRKGGMPQMILEYILKQNGLEPFNDVDIITNIQFSATAGSFINGIGDYTAEFEPTASTLENEGKGHVVASLGKASGNVPYTSYMATQSYIKQNPDTIKKFTKAIYKGQQWVANHDAAEIAKAIQPQFKETNLELLTQIVARYKDQQTWKEIPVCDEAGYELLQNVLESAGELKERIEFEAMVDNRFAEEIVE